MWRCKVGDLSHEFQLHVLLGFQCGASAFGRFIRNGSAVHGFSSGGSSLFDCGRKRKIVGGFCGAIGRSDLVEKPEFATNAQRVRNRRDLEKELAIVFRERQMADWLERLRGAGVPCSPVLDFEEVVAHPQSKEREMFPVIAHPQAGPQRITGTPLSSLKRPVRLVQRHLAWASTPSEFCRNCCRWMAAKSGALFMRA